MQLSWQQHLDLSAMHFAWCLQFAGNRVNVANSTARDAAEQVAEIPSLLGVPVDRFWESALTLSVECTSNDVFAERLLSRLKSRHPNGSRLESEVSARVTGLESEFRSLFPNFADEMPLRREPLKQLWEAHGPGLLNQVGHLTEPSMLVESARVVLVQPIIGGAGFAHLLSNRVQIEAVLANLDPRLPETMRLAWLLAQLDLERPTYSEMVNSHRLREVAGLALMPPVLLAAEELGMSQFTQDNLNAAIQLWQPERQASIANVAGGTSQKTHSSATAEVVMAWWETYLSGRPAWRIALAGLDRMLADLEQCLS